MLDKVIPDAAQREQAKLKMLELADAGEFRELDRRMEAIVMEAKSADPWTSRARPAFLYVMYLMILASLPMGVVYMISPEKAELLVGGMTFWLQGIPGELYTLFGAGYLGYVVNPSKDKELLLGKTPKPGLLSRAGMRCVAQRVTSTPTAPTTFPVV